MLAYNRKRVINILGVKDLIAAVGQRRSGERASYSARSRSRLPLSHGLLCVVKAH
jgi:hypothetical protein